jgi:hypothetical protein
MKKLLLVTVFLLVLTGCSNPVSPSLTQSYKIHFNKNTSGDWYFTVNGQNKTTILFEDQEVIIYSKCN